MKRRSFFKFSLATAFTSILKPQSIFGMQALKNPGRNSNPVVISTWSHGIEANEAAWKVLGNSGSSLDAVEQGVKITESDLSNRSVGIGGRPDRTGHVTLDACIMNKEGNYGAVTAVENITQSLHGERYLLEVLPRLSKS